MTTLKYERPELEELELLLEGSFLDGSTGVDVDRDDEYDDDYLG